VPLTILKFAAGVTLPRRAYLDTNLIIDARDAAARKYIPASTCLAELIRQGVQLNVSGPVFDELRWTYLCEVLDGSDDKLTPRGAGDKSRKGGEPFQALEPTASA
jgi:hypothetical protein